MSSNTLLLQQDLNLQSITLVFCHKTHSSAAEQAKAIIIFGLIIFSVHLSVVDQVHNHLIYNLNLQLTTLNATFRTSNAIPSQNQALRIK